MQWRSAERRPRWAAAADSAVILAGVMGGVWGLAALLALGRWGPEWAKLAGDGAGPVGLAAAIAAGVAHAWSYAWVRQRGWWTLPLGVMVAGAVSGLMGGGLIAATTMVLTPALMGFPELNRMIFDLQPPFTTPVIAAVTLWAMVGMGAASGGAVGLLIGALACPVMLAAWAVLLWADGRWGRRSLAQETLPAWERRRAA